MPSQNMSLWHMDYFELKSFANKQVQKEAFLELPLSE